MPTTSAPGRNLHFYAAIPSGIPAIDNLTGNSNYRPDHNRHIYADQRYYLSLDDYGTQFGLPANFAAAVWSRRRLRQDPDRETCRRLAKRHFGEGCRLRDA